MSPSRTSPAPTEAPQDPHSSPTPLPIPQTPRPISDDGTRYLYLAKSPTGRTVCGHIRATNVIAARHQLGLRKYSDIQVGETDVTSIIEELLPDNWNELLNESIPAPTGRVRSRASDVGCAGAALLFVFFFIAALYLMYF